jgi:NitT/TauT family transport system permease protein
MTARLDEPDTSEAPRPLGLTPSEQARAEVRARVEAGLDALDTPVVHERSLRRTLVRSVLPPIVAVALVVLLWQVLWAAAIWPEYQLPEPAAVWREFSELVTDGRAVDVLWTSLHRAVIGFAIAVVVGVPLGMLIGTVHWVRAAIGPVVSGLMSLPSVAWVPAAILWFGLTPTTIYAVILLGATPSIANGLVAGLDQIPTILPRVGRALGASRLQSARHILLPASLPGFIAGLKQGWAFAWRSLMAAELIAGSPQLGLGLGQLLDQGRALNDMPKVLTAIFLILLVGIAVDVLLFRPLERRVLRTRGLTGVR